MNKSANEQWLKDFNEFTRSEVEVPKELSSRVFNKIQGLLNPSPIIIFFKVIKKLIFGSNPSKIQSIHVDIYIFEISSS